MSSTAERLGRFAKHTLAVVPIHGPTARRRCRRKRLAIHDRVGDCLRAIVGYPLLDCRWKLRAGAERNSRNRHGHGDSERVESLTRAARGRRAHALDERHRLRER